MAINKTPSGKYRVRVKLSTGKWLTRTCPSIQSARKVELKFKERAIVGEVLGIHKTPRLRDIWQLYVKYAKVHKKSWAEDEARWRLHVRPKLPSYKSLKMDKIAPSQLQGIIDGMAKTHSPATRKQVLQLINRVYNWSIQQMLYHGHNPCKAIKSPTVNNKVTECLSKSEIERLLNAAESFGNERAELTIRFALFTGKRRGEILKLTWDCVDFRRKLATFKDTKNGETHTLPLNEKALDVLKRAEEIKISELVFPCSTGKYYWDHPATWRRIRAKAGLTLRFHGLRHTYASLLAQSGKVSMFELKELLNHKSLKMVERYAHFFPDHLKGATNVIDSMFQ